jgi:hypothetical protein
MKTVLLASGALLLPFAAIAAFVLGVMAAADPANAPLAARPWLLHAVGVALLLSFAACVAGLQRAFRKRLAANDRH